MIKNKGSRYFILTKDLGDFRVVRAPRSSLPCRSENRRDRVVTRISARIWIGIELFQQVNIQGSFFLRFSHGRRLQALAIIDKPAGQRPAERKIFSFDEDDSSAADFDDDIYGH